MAQTVLAGVEAVQGAAGTHLGYSDWLEITQDRIDLFAEATGDRQWIHVDPARAAAESPFGAAIAHGYLTVALAPALLPELLAVEKCSRVINYGIDKLRLKEPVVAGRRVRVGATLAHVRELPGGGARVSLAVRWEVEGAKRPAGTGELVYVYFP